MLKNGGLKEIFSRKDKKKFNSTVRVWSVWRKMGNPLGFGIGTIGPSVGPMRCQSSGNRCESKRLV